MKSLEESFEETFNRIMETYTPQQLLDCCESDEESDRELALLCGCKCKRSDGCKCVENLPEEELIIILERDDLDFQGKMAALKAIRGTKAKSKSFRKRITSADAIHARGLGISLD